MQNSNFRGAPESERTRFVLLFTFCKTAVNVNIHNWMFVESLDLYKSLRQLLLFLMENGAECFENSRKQ